MNFYIIIFFSEDKSQLIREGGGKTSILLSI